MFCSKTCKSCYHTVPSQRKRGVSRKKSFLERFGGQCKVCGYRKNIAALNFHHLGDKEYPLTITTMREKTFETIEREAENCELLCSNCHFQHHHPELMIAALQVDIESVSDPRAKLERTGNCLTCGQKLIGKQKYFALHAAIVSITTFITKVMKISKDEGLPAN